MTKKVLPGQLDLGLDAPVVQPSQPRREEIAADPTEGDLVVGSGTYDSILIYYDEAGAPKSSKDMPERDEVGTVTDQVDDPADWDGDPELLEPHTERLLNDFNSRDCDKTFASNHEAFVTGFAFGERAARAEAARE